MNLRVKRHFDVKFFNKFSINLKYDSVGATFNFEHFFDYENVVHRTLWQPGHFHVVEIEHAGELLVTGFVLSQTFGEKSKKQLSSISGYSLPGVLEDCQIPPSLYPLQSDGQTLAQITRKLLAYFSTKNAPISLVIDPLVADKVNSVFEKSTASETETIKGYLTKLAAQKNIVLSHTADGNLWYTKARTNRAPSFHFSPGQEGVTSMSLAYNGQGMHHQITLKKQESSEGGNAGEQTIRNPYVPYVRRPLVKTQSSGTDNDTGDAARQALSAELKGIVLTIELSTWLVRDEIVKPNNIISVINPELYIFKETNFFIESVDLVGDEKTNTATLTCVLPEVYNEDKVESIFEITEAMVDPSLNKHA